MRNKLLLLVFFLSVWIAGAQSFRLNYRIFPLGSQKGEPSPIVITIDDSVFNYWIYMPTKYIESISSQHDTTYKMEHKLYTLPFRPSSKDSIRSLIKDIAGEYRFYSNPHILSGEIEQLYIQYGDSCNLFRWKNCVDSLKQLLFPIINQYLPKKNQISEDGIIEENSVYMPFIQRCKGNVRRTYAEIIGDEFELIRINKK